MEKIKVGILGYGNLGRGVENAVNASEDMELTAVFSRRRDLKTDSGADAAFIDDLKDYKNKIDVLILCGGSATDLPKQGPEMLADFNTVDSFDTHAKIPEYFTAMDEVGKRSGKLGIISVGWDPGLFSMARMVFGAFLPDGNDYTFWGRGVSQGHSDAIRRIDGVLNAVQYTVPIETALERVRNGENPALVARDKHLRQCYVVAREGADKARIEREIKSMPNYFADYDTDVCFISEEELKKNHSKMPHGGFVLRSGVTASGDRHVAELSIKLESNPQFTGSILTAFARAVFKMSKQGRCGAITAFDVPPALISSKTAEELRAKLL